ncbi:MAG: hypothetical protein RLZZ574_959 [Cyanobacteriota bacterium]
MPKESNQNQTPVNAPDTWSGFLFLLITTKQGWLGITVVAAILAVAVLGTIYFMRPEEIEISTNSGTIALKRGNTQNALFLLSPSGGDEKTPWADTGIEVKKDDKIKIEASGRVNCAMKRTIARTIRPEIAQQTWVGPSGYPEEATPPAEHINEAKLLLDKDNASYGFGMLLANVKDSKDQIKTENIVPFVENTEFIEFTAPSDGELVLTVNDIWLSKNMKNVYAAPFEENRAYYEKTARFDAAFRDEDFNSWSKEEKEKKAKAQYERRLKSWNNIVDEGDWNIWYEDNIGSFSVSITVNEKN